jgi:hypothetical protein
MEEYEKLSKDYSNGMDKIKLLETMINGVEKVVDKTVKLDLEIKNKINGKEFNVSADAELKPGEKSVKVMDKTIEITGGGFMSVMNIIYGGAVMDAYEFEAQLNSQISELETYANQLEADNKFIDEKVNALHKRVGKIMNDTEDLMDVRLSIEWLVNELEKPIEEKEEKEEERDFTEIYNRLQTTIETVKKQKINPDVAKYIRDLEGMAKYFEDFIAANKNTLNNMPDSKKNEMLETLKNIQGMSGNLLSNNKTGAKNNNDEELNTSLEGGWNRNVIGGGLRDYYNKINTQIINEINEKYSSNNTTINVIFVNSDNTPFDNVDNKIISEDDVDNDVLQDNLK